MACFNDNMCFYTSQNKRAEAIAKKYGRKLDIIEAARQILAEQEAEQMQKQGQVNVYETHLNDGMFVSPGWAHPISVIVSGSDQLQIMRWGLIPYYVTLAEHDQYIRQSRYRNARAENLFTSRLWSRITNNRCVYPVSGFMEPHVNSDNSRTPYYIERIDQEEIPIAGLYDVWIHPVTGKRHHTFVMITVPATPKLCKIHNGGDNPCRMPLILTDDMVEAWVNPEMKEQADIKKFLVTPDIDSQIVAWPIRNKFDRCNPFDPSIIQRVPAQEELDF